MGTALGARQLVLRGPALKLPCGGCTKERKIRNVVEIHNPEAKKIGSGCASQVLRVRLSPPNFLPDKADKSTRPIAHPSSCRTS
jgi:hypothetical protein